jgi:type I restriction enzyme M protein
MWMLQMSEGNAFLKLEHFILSLFARQNEANISELFDNTLLEIPKENRHH